MSPDAFAVHGLSDAFLADKPRFGEVAAELLAFIGDDPLVIHNAAFDTNFLNHELRRLKIGPIAPDRVVDTLLLARRRHPGAQNSLDALCARYGIDTSRRTRHGALLDAEILAEVYAELTGGRQSSLGLARFAGATAAPGGAGPVAPGLITAEFRNRPLITPEERAMHRAFVAEMGEKALWRLYLTAGAEAVEPAPAKP